MNFRTVEELTQINFFEQLDINIFILEETRKKGLIKYKIF